MSENLFSRSLKSWNDVTIVPSLLLLISRFVPHRKLWHGEGKSLLEIFFAVLISTLRRFNWAKKKKICHIHFKELFVMWGHAQSSLVSNKPTKPFSIQECIMCIVIFAKWNSSALRNCLLLSPAHLFYIRCICTCLPCDVVKNGKIILCG